ncbi:hypothetical protein F7725_018711 [Dissostichus mawsoni]|uniref:CTCK domain-containing protein n=1 Tax=Dissostichus mawsoni TaxID=36200 RepID=A0A7J5XS79_DISMA|nr:hypothetical protein F7725_018711 [Dissostichus mawsoni]
MLVPDVSEGASALRSPHGPPGVPLILDDCVCCWLCPSERQLCSDMNPCDTRKGLQCDYSTDVHKRTGTCAANKGEVCVLDGSVYQNGQPSSPAVNTNRLCAKLQFGRDVAWPDCPMPRRVQVPGECCEKWVCEPQAEASALGGFAMADHRVGGLLSNLQHGGVHQVTNKNSRCEMVKQSRLCMIRPCDDQQDQTQQTPIAPKRGSKCQRMVRSDKAVHLSYKNCTSVQAYKPRYCGTCTDARCCTPHRTRPPWWIPVCQP